MSAIITTLLATSGLSPEMIISDQSGNIWNGSTFESYLLANYATYLVPMVEQVPRAYYKANFPAAIPAGIYDIAIYADSTAGSPPYNSARIDWSGSIENHVGLITGKLPSGSISGFDPTTTTVNLGSNQSGVTIGTTNALGSSAAASVYTQVSTAIGSDSIAELSGVPSATPTLKQAVMFLFMALRNKRTSTNTTVSIYNNSNASISSATQSNSSTLYTKDKFS